MVRMSCERGLTVCENYLFFSCHEVAPPVTTITINFEEVVE
jgi:hypothetical protein